MIAVLSVVVFVALWLVLGALGVLDGVAVKRLESEDPGPYVQGL